MSIHEKLKEGDMKKFQIWEKESYGTLHCQIVYGKLFAFFLDYQMAIQE